jgi:DNA primase
MNSPVQQIKERLTIEDVVSSYIKLERVGTNLKARCPFHNEKTPSFFVSTDRGTYYCFGCAASGDIFSFVEEFEGLDFKGALKLLAERAGVPLTAYTKEDQKNQSEKDRLYEVMEEATKYFEENLSTSKEAEEYLKQRGLTGNSIKDFRIGFAILDWRLLYNRLKAKGFSDGDIEKAGLAKKTEKGYYDRFRGRIMFPIADSSGRIIAFSGRLFVDDGKSAKYLNSPETPIFSKYAVLYGLDKAKESIRKNNFSILVEGQMDLVLSHQAGFKNTIATSGTALSDSTVSKDQVVSNLGLVRRLSGNIVLAFDADKAGFNATDRAGKIALSLGMDVKVAAMPENMDPADLISKTGADAWKEAIRKSKHIIEFLLDRVLKDSGDDARKAGRGIKEKILPYVDSLGSSIEKTHFLKKISDQSGIPMPALEEDLRHIEKELQYEKREIEEAIQASAKIYRKDRILNALLGILLWQRGLATDSTLADKIENNLLQILNLNKEELLAKAKGIENDLISRAEFFYSGGGNLEKDVGEMLLNLGEEYLNEERFKKIKELHLYEEKKDLDRGRKVLEEINEINKKIENIKSNRANK